VNWKEIINSILKWGKEIIPTASLIASMVYRYMKRKINRSEAQTKKVELELEESKNRELVEKKYRDKSNVDIIDDAIAEGRRLRGSDND